MLNQTFPEAEAANGLGQDSKAYWVPLRQVSTVTGSKRASQQGETCGTSDWQL